MNKQFLEEAKEVLKPLISFKENHKKKFILFTLLLGLLFCGAFDLFYNLVIREPLTLKSGDIIAQSPDQIEDRTQNTTANIIKMPEEADFPDYSNRFFKDWKTIAINIKHLDEQIQYHSFLSSNYFAQQEGTTEVHKKKTAELKKIKKFLNLEKITYIIKKNRGKKGVERNYKTIIPYNFSDITGIKPFRLGDNKIIPDAGESLQNDNYLLLIDLQVHCHFIVRAPNGKYGLYYDDREILPARYDKIEYAGDFYFIVTSNKKKGILYFDRFIIDPVHSSIVNSGEGEFILKNGSQAFYTKITHSFNPYNVRKQKIKTIAELTAMLNFDISENEIPFDTEIVQKGSINNYFLWNHNRQLGLINFWRKKSTGFIYGHGAVLENGIIQVFRDGKSGILNSRLEVVAEPVYDSVSYFYDYLFFLKRVGENGNRYSLVNSENNQVYELSYTRMERAFKNGFFFTGHEGKKGLYINLDDSIPPVYDSVVLYTTDNRWNDLIVQGDNAFGYISKANPYRLLIKPTNFCYRLSKNYFLFFPHLVLNGIVLPGFIYWYLCAIAAIGLFCYISAFFKKTIAKNNWNKYFFYLTAGKKVLYEIISLYYSLLIFFPVVLTLLFCLITWLLLIPFTIASSLLIVCSGAFFILRFFYNFGNPGEPVVCDNGFDYYMSAGEFLPSYLFKNIKYNKDGKGEVFLVLTSDNKWIIINRDLQPYEKEGITTTFSRFVREDKGIFIMEEEDDEYYLFIKGRIPRINKKTQNID